MDVESKSPEKQELEKDLEGETLKVGPSVTCLKGTHIFRLIKGNEAECTKCPVSYPIGVGSTVKDGHIYHDNQFVI